MTGRNPGPQRLSARDWLYGSRPRRLLIEHAIGRRPPVAGWTKSALARASDTSVHGGVDDHVDGLQRLGLLVPSGSGTWVPASPRPKLARALVSVSRLLETVPDHPPAAGTPAERPPLPDVRRALRRARNAIGRSEQLAPATRNAALAALHDVERLLDKDHEQS